MRFNKRPHWLRFQSQPLARLLLALLLLIPTGALRAQPPASVWRTYHDYARMTRDLKDLAAAHPDLIRLDSLATTEGGRNIWLATITNRQVDKDKTEVLFDGAIHGSEVIGSESMLAYIHYLVENHASDPDAQQVVDRWVTYVIPMVNPDGVEAGKSTAQGKVARKNARRVDLNRNFDWHWNEAGGDSKNSWEYRGEEAFSEIGSRAIRDFVRAHHVLLYLNAHSGTEGRHLITERNSKDEDLFATIGAAINKQEGYRRVLGHKPGEAGHWVYWVGMQSMRDAGNHPLGFALEIYTKSSIKITDPDWWHRYQPITSRVDFWTTRVRHVLLYLTQFTPRLARR